MKSLLAAALIVGAFFLGAYVQQAAPTAGPGLLDYAAIAPDPAPTASISPPLIPPLSPPWSEATSVAPLVPQAPRPTRPARHAGRDCLPAMLADGVTYTDAAHVCGTTVSGLARHP